MKYYLFFIFLSLVTKAVEAATWKKVMGVVNTLPTSMTAGKALTSSQCPDNFIFIPKNINYSVVDFCVAKYEMKNDGYGTAVSTATGAPWVSIIRSTARSKCQALGAGYDMISNDQWQTIARNIAGVASNWDSGTVASGQLNPGHSDGSPWRSLAASLDDINGNCTGTGQTCSSLTWNSQRRTHVLSNGNVIWDFSGNVEEWVTNDSNVSNGAGGYISEMSGEDIRQTRYGADSATLCASPSSTPYCGMGYGMFNSTAGAVFRGGGWSGDTFVGVFSVDLTPSLTYAGNGGGFRCVYVP